MATGPPRQLPSQPPPAHHRRALSAKDPPPPSLSHTAPPAPSQPLTPRRLPLPGAAPPPRPGPAGVGKSATVRALAADLGFEIVEWTSPVPTLFEEHLHARGADATLEYQSKVRLLRAARPPRQLRRSRDFLSPLPPAAARRLCGKGAPRPGARPRRCEAWAAGCGTGANASSQDARPLLAVPSPPCPRVSAARPLRGLGAQRPQVRAAAALLRAPGGRRPRARRRKPAAAWSPPDPSRCSFTPALRVFARHALALALALVMVVALLPHPPPPSCRPPLTHFPTEPRRRSSPPPPPPPPSPAANPLHPRSEAHPPGGPPARRRARAPRPPRRAPPRLRHGEPVPGRRGGDREPRGQPQGRRVELREGA